MSEIALPRRNFLGITFTPLDLEDAVRRIVAREPASPFAYVVTPNAQHVVAAYRGDVRFRQGQAGAWMTLNDSRILRLLSRRLWGVELPLAVGSDLVARLFEVGMAPDTPIVVIGGDPRLEVQLRERFGLRAIARHEPSFGFYRDEIQIEACLDFIRTHPARYIFLVVGAPQSEILARRLVGSPGLTGVALCVGSALNFLTGRIRRAPLVIRVANLEWAYRLAQRPIGHFRRVFIESLPILWIALKEKAAHPRST
ncbi:WecB/TagA/CpsF family glycosyltransferase [Brevundimonas sp.]|uniref:WecB/TagA/CpsF family glycosyltransferase n=1 Tax=Brevundimonas sp. TaxID=1871086 RepID=UPI003BAB30C4